MRSNIVYLVIIFAIMLCHQSSAIIKFKPTPETHPHAFFRPISPPLASSPIEATVTQSPSQSSAIPLSPHPVLLSPTPLSTPPDRTAEDASPIRPSSQSPSTPASASPPQGYTAYCYHSFNITSYVNVSST